NNNSSAMESAPLSRNWSFNLLRGQDNARCAATVQLKAVILENAEHAIVARCDFGKHLSDLPTLANFQAIASQHGTEPDALVGVGNQDGILGIGVIRIRHQTANPDQLALVVFRDLRHD